jgi:hypothetical protein
VPHKRGKMLVYDFFAKKTTSLVLVDELAM